MFKSNEKLNNAAMIISRVIEIGLWVGTGLLSAALLSFLFFKDRFLHLFLGFRGVEFEILGYTINVADASGNLLTPNFIAALVVGVITLGLSAMIYRNVCLIFKYTMGKTKHSKGLTPFQPDNVRMLREIGIFSIAIPVVQFAVDNLLVLIAGVDAVESSCSLSGVFFGILLLCLSQFFAYGVQLQKEQDGLV